MLRSVLLVSVVAATLVIPPTLHGQQPSDSMAPPIVVAEPPAEPFAAPAPAPAGKVAVTPLRAPASLGGNARSLSAGLAPQLNRLGHTAVDTETVGFVLDRLGNKAILDCSEPSCLTQIGQAVGAAQVVHGQLEELGEGVLLTLILADTASGRELSRQTAFWKGDREQLGQVSEPYLRRLLAGDAASTLRGGVAVTAPAGARVLVDGTERGLAPLSGELSLDSGVHSLEVLQAGQKTWRKEIIVRASSHETVVAVLVPEASVAVAVAPPPPVVETVPPTPVPAPTPVPEPSSVAPVATPAPAAVQGPQRTIALLDLRSDEDTKNMASALTVVVASELGRTPGYRTVSRNDLKSLLAHQANAQLVGCSEVQCLSDIAKMAAADLLVSGSVTRVEDAHVLSLELIDAVEARVIERQAATWRGDPARMVELARPYVDRLLAGPAAQSFVGSLELMAPEGASITVDNAVQGNAPLGQPVANLASGVHGITVAKPGYLTVRDDVVVVRGETTLVQVDLVDENADKPWYSRWWVWGSIGGGLALIGGTAAAIAVVAVLTNTPTTVGVSQQ
ncbi:MAG: PEGA domain-containing protein [Pseudomonadota bacterium]